MAPQLQNGIIGPTQLTPEEEEKRRLLEEIRRVQAAAAVEGRPTLAPEVISESDESISRLRDRRRERAAMPGDPSMGGIPGVPPTGRGGMEGGIPGMPVDPRMGGMGGMPVGRDPMLRERMEVESELRRLRQPVEPTKGWEMIGDVLLGLGSRHRDAFLLQNQREAKRQKALDLMKERQGDLRQQQADLRQARIDEQAKRQSAATTKELLARAERQRAETIKLRRPEPVTKEYEIQTVDRPDGKYLVKVDQDTGEIVFETKLGPGESGSQFKVVGNRVFNVNTEKFIEPDSDLGADTGPPKEEYVGRLTDLSIKTIDDLLPLVNEWSTGWGSLLQYLPETEADYLEQQMDALHAQIAYGELVRMRDASKTGGALGQVSDFEGKQLAKILGAISTSFEPSKVRSQLIEIRRILQTWKDAQIAYSEDPPPRITPDGIEYRYDKKTGKWFKHGEVDLPKGP